jgi:multiple sugar transport system permease protein
VNQVERLSQVGIMRSPPEPRPRWGHCGPGLGYLLCLPALAVVLGLLCYPVIHDLWISLTGASVFSRGEPFVGLHNYVRMFTADPLYWEAARNTMALTVLTAVVEMVLGMLTALLLWWRFWGRSLVFLAVFVPWAFPSSFSAFAWYWLLLPPFHSFYSPQAVALKLWLENDFGWGAMQVLAIAVMNVWRGSSIIAIILLAGFNAIPEELLEYGRLEAKSRWRYFWRVVLPLNRRITVLAALVALTITYLDFVSMYPESGGRIVDPVIGTLAYMQEILNGQTSYAAGLAVTQLPAAFILAFIGLHFVERRRPPRPPREGSWSLAGGRAEWLGTMAASTPSPPPRPVSPRRRRLGARLAQAAGLVAALLVFAFHLFPVYYTAVQAVRPLEEFYRGQIFWAYHPEWERLLDTIQDPTFLEWARNTLIVFGLALVVGLGVSLLAGYGLARFRPPGASLLARLSFLTYFVPQTAVILPLYQMYRMTGLDNTITGIVLVYLTLVVPFSTWLFYSYFLGMDVEVEQHAWLDATRLQTFFRVVLPMSWPVVIAAALFSVGMMGSDVLYAGLISLTNDTLTLPAGYAIAATGLDEWADTNAAILVASLPLILACAALGRYYVRGLRSALLEGA